MVRLRGCVFTYKTQFLKLNLSFHTVCFGYGDGQPHHTLEFKGWFTLDIMGYSFHGEACFAFFTLLVYGLTHSAFGRYDRFLVRLRLW